MTPDEHDTQIRLRIAQDVMAGASAIYWRRRADMFEWARPRKGDYAGRASAADIRERDRRCSDTAEACRAQADLIDQEWRGVAA